MNFPNKWQRHLPILFLVICLTGCARTITTVRTVPKSASFDAGGQNSGLLYDLPDHSSVITPHARDRYNALIAVYGSRFAPPLKPDDGITATSTNTFILDAQHKADALRMNLWRKSGQ